MQHPANELKGRSSRGIKPRCRGPGRKEERPSAETAAGHKAKDRPRGDPGAQRRALCAPRFGGLHTVSLQGSPPSRASVLQRLGAGSSTSRLSQVSQVSQCVRRH